MYDSTFSPEYYGSNFHLQQQDFCSSNERKISTLRRFETFSFFAYNEECFPHEEGVPKRFFLLLYHIFSIFSSQTFIGDKVLNINNGDFVGYAVSYYGQMNIYTIIIRTFK